jgi:hypothetical protein
MGIVYTNEGHSEINLSLFYYATKSRRAHACEVASHDSLPCKPSHDWSLSVFSCLYRVSYDVSCD